VNNLEGHVIQHLPYNLTIRVGLRNAHDKCKIHN